jgi:hypothetical protein
MGTTALTAVAAGTDVSGLSRKMAVVAIGPRTPNGVAAPKTTSHTVSPLDLATPIPSSPVTATVARADSGSKSEGRMSQSHAAPAH